MFFGCDVGKSSERVNGVMDTALYDTKAAYGFDFNMTKRERLETGETLMTHAMVITAVHLDDKGRPVRYKVENSWSDAVGDHGWFMMTADWFREHVFQVVIPSSVAEKKWVDIFKGGNPVVLPAWDPMVSRELETLLITRGLWLEIRLGGRPASTVCRLLYFAHNCE